MTSYIKDYIRYLDYALDAHVLCIDDGSIKLIEKLQQLATDQVEKRSTRKTRMPAHKNSTRGKEGHNSTDNTLSVGDPIDRAQQSSNKRGSTDDGGERAVRSTEDSESHEADNEVDGGEEVDDDESRTESMSLTPVKVYMYKMIGGLSLLVQINFEFYKQHCKRQDQSQYPPTATNTRDLDIFTCANVSLAPFPRMQTPLSKVRLLSHAKWMNHSKIYDC